MKTIEEQHEEVSTKLKNNTANHLPFLGCNIKITKYDGEMLEGKCNGIGGYYLTICGIYGHFDESLKGKTKNFYADIHHIEIIK